MSRVGDAIPLGRTVSVALVLLFFAAACTAPPPGDGDTTTTTSSEPSTTTTTTSTSPSSTSTTTTSSEPTTTTTTEPPAPDIDDNFSITVAGELGEMWFTPSNARIGVTQSNQIDHQELAITIWDRSTDDQTRFTFASREGSQEYFAVDHYGDAQQWPWTDPGRPGMRISPLGFCSTEFGDFEVREIRRDGPKITGIWITYVRYCGDAGPWEVEPAYGEIRLGHSVTDYEVSPQVVRWPPGTYPDRKSYDVPIYVRPTSDETVEVTDVAVSGRHADDFPIRDNGCSGVLGAEGCVVRVGFVPQAPGPRHASLRVTTSSGATDVSLDGAGAPGQSEWVLDVDYEDPNRPDEHLVMNSATAGGPYEFRSAAVSDEGRAWRARFYLSPPEPFVAGREYIYSPDGAGLRMSLAYGNAACEIDQATMSITDLGFTDPDDRLALLDLDMEADCRASYGHTVQGRIRFHDRDDQTAPAAVTDATAVRDGDRVILEWTNPDDTDLAGVIIRSYTGDVAPGAPDAGDLVYFDNGDSTTIPAPGSRPTALSIWTYDHTGNVGTPYELQLQP